MQKVYRYRDLSYSVGDNDPVHFTVEFVTDGNTGYTVINVPGPNDPELEDEGTVFIGLGQDLRGDTTVSFSDLANLAAPEDTITIRYFVNGTLLQEHTNKKAVEERPIVILFIKFPKP